MHPKIRFTRTPVSQAALRKPQFNPMHPNAGRPGDTRRRRRPGPQTTGTGSMPRDRGAEGAIAPETDPAPRRGGLRPPAICRTGQSSMNKNKKRTSGAGFLFVGGGSPGGLAFFDPRRGGGNFFQTILLSVETRPPATIAAAERAISAILDSHAQVTRSPAAAFDRVRRNAHAVLHLN